MFDTQPEIFVQCMSEHLLLICAFTNTGYCWLMYSPDFKRLLQWGRCTYLKAHKYTFRNLTKEKAHVEINIGTDRNVSRLIWGMVMKPWRTSRLITSKTKKTKREPRDRLVRRLYIPATSITLSNLAESRLLLVSLMHILSLLTQTPLPRPPFITL